MFPVVEFTWRGIFLQVLDLLQHQNCVQNAALLQSAFKHQMIHARQAYLLSKIVLQLNLLVVAGSLGLPSLAQLFFCPDGSHLSSPLLPLCLVHLCTANISIL